MSNFTSIGIIRPIGQGFHAWVVKHVHVLHTGFATLAVTSVTFIGINAALYVAQIGKVPLLTRVNGQSIGFMSPNDAKLKLANNYATKTIDLKIAGSTKSLNALDAGISMELDKTITQATSLTGWQRLPILNLITNSMASYEPYYSLSEEKLQSNLKNLIADQQTEAVDAKLVIPEELDQQITITAEKSGSVINAEIVAAQIASSVQYSNSFSVNVASKTVEPKVKSDNLAPLVNKVKAVTSSNITIKSANQSVVLSGPELRKLVVVSQSDTEEPHLLVDRGKLTKLLNQKASTFYVAPVATQVTLLDGQSVSRVDGASGTALDINKTAIAVEQAFTAGVAQITASLSSISAPLLYTNNYSQLNGELYKIIEDFIKTHAGKIRVATAEVGLGGSRTAYYGPDESMATASTYKVFMAYAALKKIEEGKMAFDTSTSKGTIDHCINRMIIVSDNDCGVAIGSKIGWSVAQSMVQSVGFTKTLLTSNDYTLHSTARDEMNMMSKLYSGQLLTAEHTKYLLDLMKQQVYRAGIPAGSRGAVVADKVGFEGSVLNDMGIVYGPKSTYSLAIMTTGSSWGDIKALSQQIYDFYNR